MSDELAEVIKAENDWLWERLNVQLDKWSAAQAERELVEALVASWEAERPFLGDKQEPIAAAHIGQLRAALKNPPGSDR